MTGLPLNNNGTRVSGHAERAPVRVDDLNRVIEHSDARLRFGSVVDLNAINANGGHDSSGNAGGPAALDDVHTGECRSDATRVVQDAAEHLTRLNEIQIENVCDGCEKRFTAGVVPVGKRIEVAVWSAASVSVLSVAKGGASGPGWTI